MMRRPPPKKRKAKKMVYIKKSMGPRNRESIQEICEGMSQDDNYVADPRNTMTKGLQDKGLQY